MASHHYPPARPYFTRLLHAVLLLSAGVATTRSDLHARVPGYRDKSPGKPRDNVVSQDLTLLQKSGQQVRVDPRGANRTAPDYNPHISTVPTPLLPVQLPPEHAEPVLDALARSLTDVDELPAGVIALMAAQKDRVDIRMAPWHGRRFAVLKVVCLSSRRWRAVLQDLVDSDFIVAAAPFVGIEDLGTRHDVSPPADVDRYLNPLTADPDPLLTVAVTMQAGAKTEFDRIAGSAVTGWRSLPLMEATRGEAVMEAQVQVSDITALCRVLATMGEALIGVSEGSVREALLRHLAAVKYDPTNEERWEPLDQPDLSPCTPTLTLPGPRATESAFKRSSGAAAQLMVLCAALHHLDRHGSTEIAALAEAVDTSPENLLSLLTTAVSGPVAAPIAIAGEPDGTTVVSGNGDALASVGRYSVGWEQLLPAAKELSELAPQLDDEMAEAVAALLNALDDALGFPWQSIFPNLASDRLTRQLASEIDAIRKLGDDLVLTYASPWAWNTRDRVIRPLKVERERGDNWVLIGTEITATDGLHEPKTFLLRNVLSVKPQPRGTSYPGPPQKAHGEIATRTVVIAIPTGHPTERVVVDDWQAQAFKRSQTRTAYRITVHEPVRARLEWLVLRHPEVEIMTRGYQQNAHHRAARMLAQLATQSHSQIQDR